MPIDITLEKRCIKYLWNVINSNCKLYRNIVNLSLNNVSTTIGENLRYFMQWQIQGGGAGGLGPPPPPRNA